MASLFPTLLDISGNSLDRYHLVRCLPRSGIQTLTYGAFQLANFNQGEGCFDEYEFKISLWSTSSSRVSRDACIDVLSASDIHFFEIPASQSEIDHQTYFYIDLVHRATGVSMASGSRVLAKSEQDKAINRNTPFYNEEDGSLIEYMLWKVSIELNISENFKFWTLPDVGFVSQNGNSTFLLHANIGRTITYGHLHDNSHNVNGRSVVVPSIRPSLFDCLNSSLKAAAGSAECINQTKYSEQDNYIRTLNSKVWYLTVDDLQLTSDILDLYLDRNILVTGGCGGSASLAPHSYLGHIRRCQGNFIEQAELAVISAAPATPCGDACDLFESCLSLEVKVVECAAGRFGEEAVDQCIICTGVLHRAHRVADPEETPADNLAARDESGSAAVMVDALSPSRLLSGQYEVLLYTIYNPDTELDVALVGRATVSLHVPELDLDPTQLNTILDRTDRFDPARFFEISNDRLAFLYWSVRLSCCCFDLSNVGTLSTLSNNTSALTERVSAIHELEALLCTLALPTYSEKLVLSRIIAHLQLSTTPEQKVAIVPALDNYFQEWLTGEALNDLMTTSTEDPSTEQPLSHAEPASPELGASRKAPSPGRSPSSRNALAGRSGRQLVDDPFQNFPNLSWRSLTAGSACLRILMAFCELTCSSADESLQGQSHNHLDSTILEEITEDLIVSLIRYLARMSNIWESWCAGGFGTVKSKSQEKLGFDFLERLENGIAIICLLFQNLAEIGPGTEAAMYSFILGLRSACERLVHAAATDNVLEAAVEDDWRAQISVRMGDVLSGVLLLVSAHLYPAVSNTKNEFSLCLQSILSSIECIHTVGLRQVPSANLILSVTECIELLTGRVGQRLASFPVSGVDAGKLEGAFGSSLARWIASKEEAALASAIKVVQPPSGFRKANRRASAAANVFGVDVTLDSTRSTSSNIGISVGRAGWDFFSPAANATQPITREDEDERKKMMLSASLYAEGAVLYFLQENATYLKSLISAIDCLLLLQPISSHRQTSIGQVTALGALMNLLDDVVNALLRGRVLSPELLQVLIESAVDNDGLHGRGLRVFMELYSGVHDRFFTYLSERADQLITSDDADVFAMLAFRMECVTAFHFHFFELHVDAIRTDKHLSRTAWANFSNGDWTAALPGLSASVSTTVSGLGFSARARRVEGFTTAGSEAVLNWLAIRQLLCDTIYMMCVCAVCVANAADQQSLLSSDAHAPLSTAFGVAFSHAVTLLCRCALMKDLDQQKSDIIPVINKHSPLSSSLESLYRLAESIPVSLQAPSQVSITGEQLLNPVSELITACMDIVKIDLALHPYAASEKTSYVSTISALAQLLEDRTIRNIRSSGSDALFNIKILMRCLLSDYILGFEDPAWSAQPVILPRRPGETKPTLKRSPPASAFPELIAQEVLSLSATNTALPVSLVHFQREYAMHLSSLKILLCARNTLTNGDPLLSRASMQQQLFRSMFEKTLLSSSVTNMLVYGLQFMNCGGIRNDLTSAAQSITSTSARLLSMVELLAHTFSTKPQSGSTPVGFGQSSSELLSVFGCSFKAFHDTLRLLILHKRYSLTPINSTAPAGASSVAAAASEASKRLEMEISQLRHCLQWMLCSGQWETGIHIARVYLEKFRIEKAVSSIPILSRAPMSPNYPGNMLIPTVCSQDSFGSPMRSIVSPVAHKHFTFLGTDIPTPDSRFEESPAPMHFLSSPLLTGKSLPMTSHTKRHETIKSELYRVLDTMQSRINSDGDLRLFSQYYAVMFVSDRPWEVLSGDETLGDALKHICTDRLENFSASWLHARQASDASSTTGLFEYWIVMKFDTSSYPVCADFYDDILAQEAQRRAEGDRFVSGYLSLQSPISYHNIQAQLAMAFPGFSMVTSHHQMENYLGEEHGSAVDVDKRKLSPGSVGYMQLFQAFPAELCEDAFSPEVAAALQAIQDAKTASTTVTAENLLDQDDFSLKDGAGGQANLEEKSSNEAQPTTVKAENKADLHTELEKYAFAAPCPTRFYAYTLLSEDQLTVMNDQALDRSEMAESSAYIYRYELCVSESVIDYSVLGGECNNPQEKDTYSTTGRFGESVPAVATAAENFNAREEMQMGIFCVSPVNLAMHRSSARCTPIQASIEMLYYHAVLLKRAVRAMQQLNNFTKAELANEPTGDIISSDSIFAGVFTLLSNLLTTPNANCCSFSNMETILVSEQERIDLEWQAERKDAKRTYLRQLEEFEEEKYRETKSWKKLMKLQPAEPDLEALKAAFDAQPSHTRLHNLQVLHDEAQLLMWRTIKELRKFVTNKEEKDKLIISHKDLRAVAMKKGRRPSVTNMVLRTSIANNISRLPTKEGEGEEEPEDTEKSLKMKLCLYLESLFASMEVGIPI